MKLTMFKTAMTIFAVLLPGYGQAQDSLAVPEGCVATVRVDWSNCVSAVIYQCDGTGDVAWVQSRMVGPYVNTALSYDAQGNVIRQLGTGSYANGPLAVVTDGFDFDLLQQSRGETIAFEMGSEHTVAEFFLDHGFRFHTNVSMMRADMIGRSTAPGRDDIYFDQSAYFLPEIPVMMVNDNDPNGVVWAVDDVDLAGGQQCTNL